MTGPRFWYRLPLVAFLPGQPTHFTASVFGPAAGQAIAAAYEAYGAPLVGQALVWNKPGRQAALNRAVLDAADQSLRASLDGGGLGRLFGGGNRRAATLTSQTLQETPETIDRTERWWTRVRAMEWRQATVLQVMEELEPRAGDILAAQQRVALGLALALHQLGNAANSAAVPDLSAGLDDGLPDAGYAAAVQRLASALPVGGLVAAGAPPEDRPAVATFLADYGRWAGDPLETAGPRWGDAPAALLAALPSLSAAAASANPTETARRRAAAVAAVSPQLKGGQRKQFDAAAEQVEQLAALLPQVHSAVVTVAATASYWVSGAANEALADGRLLSADEVFLLELEELKQMMTGEWSNVEQVRPIVEARKATLAAGK